MLAQPTRRQHIVPQHYSTIPSPPSSQHLAYQQLPQQRFATQQQLFDQKLLNDYLESQQQSYNTPVNAPNSFMTSAYTDFASPAIRVQRSTPTPQSLSNNYQSSMLSNGWNTYGNVQSQSLQTPVQNQNQGHQRASSSSSVGSSASQYQTASATSYQSFSNHLPTPSHTPTQESFMSQATYNDYTQQASMDQTMAAHMSMKQALMDQGDDVPDFAHSARQSVSSYDSPATPHTNLDEEAKPANGKPLCEVDSWLFNQFCSYHIPDTRQQPIVPKFERTYTDIAADNFYDPNAISAPAVQPTKPAQPSLLSPYRSNATENVQRALQAAQLARSHSPSSTASRGDSPFRKGSPYRQPSHTFNSPMLGNAAATREQNRQADAAYAMKPQMRAEESMVKTISPKDALLDYREDEDSKVPLFPDSGANEYDNQYNTGDQYTSATQSSFDTASAQSYRRDSWAAPQFTPNFSTSTAPSLPTTSSFNFVTPAIQTSMPSIPNMPMGATSQYRSTPMTSAVEQTPEFPAHPHLTSMESSASEAEPPNGSQSSVEQFLRKPASSAADSGTYSCTYHGCTQRFETPQKLQKHKREGHRNANLGPSMTSAAILDRNTQAGPHKCERINPTTGKPCNTIFSRPYDLTRHEDTIHNARKQKVRCALCVEEKTFSRNDALTRHMRVVHPEVDFPGKHRSRRGGD
ncbi:uncharacterized protein M421DRAFT_102683 [Didymella exigua CBS 183.55]|uniref:C2H2-type domain-containing protein n=1 Tax=Didymella exigua CBS 183.55 TaxID=1150837 RepID=A0A6A5REF3_9PLEO|nr:uncharacterized protein M421DRAFT_102683 [Didymella exigua CBS 183.55]KAF1926052.1 hypothetical protein M421DRAFT_102683 [Didymella exigua CBS 183.55]